MQLYLSLNDRLKTQHQSIENILSTIHPARILLNPKPDKWNIHDNVAHLARYQQVFSDRINKILSDDKPLIMRYKAEEDPEFENWRSLEFEKLLKKIDSDRKNIYELITGLKDFQLNKIGIHKKYGSLNIVQWTEFFLLHEAHHIFSIFQLAHDTELV